MISRCFKTYDPLGSITQTETIAGSFRVSLEFIELGYLEAVGIRWGSSWYFYDY